MDQPLPPLTHTPEQLQPVPTVAEQRTGRRPSPATCWRWIRRGTRGGRLRASYIHGRWYTTPSDFDDFIRRQTEAALAPAVPTPSDIELRALGLL
jgi:hypothetical protein